MTRPPHFTRNTNLILLGFLAFLGVLYLLVGQSR
jgi:hypothetical protein